MFSTSCLNTLANPYRVDPERFKDRVNLVLLPVLEHALELRLCLLHVELACAQETQNIHVVILGLGHGYARDRRAKLATCNDDNIVWGVSLFC